jgi:hypothetical protein
MLLALWVFNVAHPGRLMRVGESEMPSFRLRRRARKDGNVVRDQTLLETGMGGDGVCEMSEGVQTRAEGSVV